MKTVLVTAAILLTIVGKSAAVIHIRCDEQEYELPVVEEGRQHCAGEVSEACKIFCLYNYIGELIPDNDLPGVNSTTYADFYPGKVPKSFNTLFAECEKHTEVLPLNLDAECTELKPYLECTTVSIKRTCSLPAPSFFLQDL